MLVTSVDILPKRLKISKHTNLHINMQYIPCNSALLAQETLFLTQKGTFFAQRSPKSVQIATNLNSRQNSVCWGLKFSSESKLFGGCGRAPVQLLPPWHKGNFLGNQSYIECAPLHWLGIFY